MPKKSHRTAARYAAKSKGKKKEKAPLHQVAAPALEVSAKAKPTPAVSPSEPVARPAIKQAPPKYRYLTSELQRIGIIAGAMFAILIVLYFVLP